MIEAVCFCYLWNKLRAWNQNCKVPTRIACLKFGTHNFIPWSYAKSKYLKVLWFFLVEMGGMRSLAVFCNPIGCLYFNLQLQFLVTQKTQGPLSFALSMALLKAVTLSDVMDCLCPFWSVEELSWDLDLVFLPLFPHHPYHPFSRCKWANVWSEKSIANYRTQERRREQKPNCQKPNKDNEFGEMNISDTVYGFFFFQAAHAHQWGAENTEDRKARTMAWLEAGSVGLSKLFCSDIWRSNHDAFRLQPN